MCKSNDKLIEFSYIFKCFFNYHKENIAQDATNSEIFETFSNTRLMKLLYFLCLESVNICGGDNDDSFEYNSENLFKYFGQFCAMPNGPVLLDIYRAMDIIPGFTYENGGFVAFNKRDINHSNILNKSLIDRYFNAMISHMSNDLFRSRDKLVELTHDLPIWTNTFIYSSQKLMSIECDDLIDEYKEYRKLLRKM